VKYQINHLIDMSHWSSHRYVFIDRPVDRLPV